MLNKMDIYATPRLILDKNQCYFYHTMNIPGYGTVKGEWNLCGKEDKYLGGVDFKNKRVLEIGTASGALCFYMEKNGADVIAYDLSDKEEWDVVPFIQYDHKEYLLKFKSHIRKLNNSFWLAHRAYQSKAKMVYGSVYSIPSEVGIVDITTFGSILLHLRDPFLALQSALRLTRETVIITDALSIKKFSFLMNFFGKFTKPCMQFLPDFTKFDPEDGGTWWYLNPEIIKKFVGLLGFGKSSVKYHLQKHKNNKRLLFTVVAHRTRKI